MDALLARQYGLLACLDLKQLKKADPSIISKTGLTMGENGGLASQWVRMEGWPHNG